MEIRIGIQSAPRELTVETDISLDRVEQELTKALAAGSLLVLPLTHGGRAMIPADKIAYVEFRGAESRPVGFGNYT